MRIISRYVLKEHVGPLVFALSALTSLLLLNYIAKQFDQLIGKGLPWTAIGEFFLLSIPFTVAMTLPMAVLVATLYAFSRLAAENEVTALKGSGISMTRLLVPVLIGATVLAGVMIWFNDQVLPRANHRLSVLQQDIARVKPTFALRERVFNEVSPGRFYLQANYVDQATSSMREITIYDMSNPTASRTIHADSGHMAMTAEQIDLVLTLFDGYVQEIPKREPGQIQRNFFRENRIRVRGVGSVFTPSETGGFKGDREMSICEMQAAVNTANSDYATTLAELENILTLQAQAALTGVEGNPVPAEPLIAPRQGLGQAYCTMLWALRSVRGQRQADAGAEATPDRPAPLDGADAAPVATAGSSTDGDAPISVEMPRRTETGATVAEEASVSDTARDDRPRPASLGPPDLMRLRQAREAQVEQIEDEAVAERQRTAGRETRRYLSPPRMIAGRIEALRSQMEISSQTVQRYDVEIQKKFALAVACVVFVLLGAPVALRFPRGGVGMTLGVSVVVFAIYYVGLIGGEALADKGMLTPFWAMWAANVVFAAVGLALLARMGREGATSRGGDFGEMRDAVRSWLARQGRRVGLPLERRRKTA